MSRISENIRKITRAWGGKTTGNGISDALSDLYNNLPFGVKTEMVEIVPEQSVTTDGDYEAQYCTYIPYTPLNNVESVTVMLNGTKYECPIWIDEEWGSMNAGGGWINESTPDFSEYPFTIGLPTGEYAEVAVHWSKDLGETITLKIIEEAEVVTQIDEKFVKGTSVFYIDATNADSDNILKDKNNKPITYEEAQKAGDNVIIYVKTAEMSCRPIARKETSKNIRYLIVSELNTSVFHWCNVNKNTGDIVE